MRTSFHHQPEAQHPNFPLSVSWQADYPIFRGEPDIAGDVGTSGKNTGPRREHPQLSDAARNPGFYDFRRQGATLNAALDLVPLSHFCTSAKNCWNSPSSSSGGPSRPSLMRGMARYFSRSIFQPRMVAPLKPGLPCGPCAPRSPFSPAAPRLPWLAISCQPLPGQGPGASLSAMKLPPLRATTSRRGYSAVSLNVPRTVKLSPAEARQTQSCAPGARAVSFAA